MRMHPDIGYDSFDATVMTNPYPYYRQLRASYPVYYTPKYDTFWISRFAEYARKNIRVKAVCPGMIDTPMWRRSISPEFTQQLLASDPLGRMGQPGEIAEAVLWLCSPAASFVNGHALAVDGGMTVD